MTQEQKQLKRLQDRAEAATKQFRSAVARIETSHSGADDVYLQIRARRAALRLQAGS